MDAIAITNREAREAFVLFIPGGYLLPSFFLEPFESLVKVSDGFSILLHVLVVDPVPLLDRFNEGRGELAESDGVSDVEALYEVGRGYGGNRVSARDVEVGDRHESCCSDGWGLIWCHRDVGVGGSETGRGDDSVGHSSLGRVCESDIGREFLACSPDRTRCVRGREREWDEYDALE